MTDEPIHDAANRWHDMYIEACAEVARLLENRLCGECGCEKELRESRERERAAREERDAAVAEARKLRAVADKAKAFYIAAWGPDSEELEAYYEFGEAVREVDDRCQECHGFGRIPWWDFDNGTPCPECGTS